MGYKFIGYVESKVIEIGLLMPYFSRADKFYFQELSEDNKKIVGFELIESETYKKHKEDFIPVEKQIEVDEGEDSVLVLRNGVILSGRYLDVINQLFGFQNISLPLDIAKNIKDLYNIDVSRGARAVRGEHVYQPTRGQRSRKSVQSRGRIILEMHINKGVSAISINGVDYKKYLPNPKLRELIELPLKVAQISTTLNLVVAIRGASVKSRAVAIRNVIIKELSKTPEYESRLWKAGLIKTEQNMHRSKRILGPHNRSIFRFTRKRD